MLGKNTILKAIHNTLVSTLVPSPVWMLGKNTILKAIHNGTALWKINLNGVNAG